MDRLMDVKISSKFEVCCSFMENESSDCCENEVVDFVIDNEFQKIDTQSIDDTKWNLIAEIELLGFISNLSFESNTHVIPFSNGPPLLEADLFILNCSYLL